MENLFVYGTLKDERIQKKIIGRFVKGIPDFLFGYEIKYTKIEGRTYPILVKGKGSVKGFFLKLMSEELKTVNEYETSVYRRIRETLRSGVFALVYVK